MGVHLFGIRHHGPGCARALRAALTELQPDCVLVEGPPDAQAVLPLLLSDAMHPPVALLIYCQAQPSRAVYYPFTHFSPEWQALRHALERDIPARFFDLPLAIQFALDERAGLDTERGREHEGHEDHEGPPNDRDGGEGSPNEREGRESSPNDRDGGEGSQCDRDDPLAMLAEAAGYTDHELWWEHQIEQRHHQADLFDGILEAMTVLRGDRPPRDALDALREAYMRQQIRAAQKEGFQRIAVVCGAWHAPELQIDSPALNPDHPSPRLRGEGLGDGLPTRSVAGDSLRGRPSPPQQAMVGPHTDAALLKGLPTLKVTATWIPWTNSRLAYRSGYGAGVTSPGWYEHLWTAPDRITIRWLTHAAGILRAAGMDTSSASVIEAVRLAESLAALRDRPMPGLAELHEATLTVLCNGQEAPMLLIRELLEIGERLGQVPPETPTVPLQRDLEALQKRLRLKPDVTAKPYDLDLREDTDRARSHVLHRLKLLNIPWGKYDPHGGGNKQGTFHEIWQVQWQVEFAVAIVEANIWGNTVAIAAAASVAHQAEQITNLPDLTGLLDRVILAALPQATVTVLARVESQAAVSSDVRHLMDALLPLARVARYGDVRGTDAAQVRPVIDALLARVLVGLPNACAALDDDAAQALVASLDHTQESLDLLDDPAQRDDWHTTLRRLLVDERIHGLVRGRTCRLLLDHRALTAAELLWHARHALSLVTTMPQAAAWIEGVLRGSGLLLLHQNGLWDVLDAWLQELPPASFIALLPILRRAFAGFTPPERRAMGEKITHLGHEEQAASSRANGSVIVIDSERAALVLPLLAHILGVKHAH